MLQIFERLTQAFMFLLIFLLILAQFVVPSNITELEIRQRKGWYQAIQTIGSLVSIGLVFSVFWTIIFWLWG